MRVVLENCGWPHRADRTFNELVDRVGLGGIGHQDDVKCSHDPLCQVVVWNPVDIVGATSGRQEVGLAALD